MGINRKRSMVVGIAILSVGCGTLTEVVHEVERTAEHQDAVDSRFPEERGIITDTLTGLLWQVGPDSNTEWMTANLWAENLDGEWRLPSKEELLGLYHAGISWNYYGPFYTEGNAVWSDSTSPHGANAWLFDFLAETGSMANTGDSRGIRGFAVRKPGR